MMIRAREDREPKSKRTRATYDTMTRANVDKKTENRRTKEHDNDYKRTQHRAKQNNNGQYDERPREHNDIRIEHWMKDQGYMTSEVICCQFADPPACNIAPKTGPMQGTSADDKLRGQENDGQDGPRARDEC